MNQTDLQNAIATLVACDTVKCSLWKGTVHYESEKRGVAPMMDFLQAGTNLHGFSAADRVVGRATAFLFVLAGVTAVYGEVMSEGAKQVLLEHGVLCKAGCVVPYIINRQGNGMCPMEHAVLELSDPQAAYLAVLETQMRLREQSAK